MSYQAVEWAFEQKIDSPGAKAVLVALAHRVDEHGLCWLGQDGIARMTAQDERTVRKHLKRLEEGYIRRERAHDERGRRTSDDTYLLAPPERLRFSAGKSSASQTDYRKKTARTYRKNQPPEESPAKESVDKDKESDHKNLEAQPTASPQAGVDEVATKVAHREGMKHLHERCGPIPDPAAQGAALKWLLNHYTLEQCRACLDALLEDDWRKTRVSWLTVNKEIGSWIARKENRNAGNERPQGSGGRDQAEIGGRPATRSERRLAELRRQDPETILGHARASATD